jgi:hypothetical protein
MHRALSPAFPLALALALTGCSPVGKPPAAPALSPAACVADLAARLDVDASADPRVCAPLAEAIATLGPSATGIVRGLRVVRDARGPCGDECPDLAAQLLSDAALASYRFGAHEMHVMDAAFGGPRWTRGVPTAAALAAYLAGLGVDWPGLVARVRSLPGAELPSGVLPDGDARVLDAIVRTGPAVMMNGAPGLADLFRHELGHAFQLNAQGAGVGVEGFATAVGWRERSGEGADGWVGGEYRGEDPIVASRLLLGLPRGDATSYVPGGAGHPTPYARFDPMEDFAESVRLAHVAPAALGEASPARLIAAAAMAPELLADPALRRFVVPGTGALLAAPFAEGAMMLVRRLGTAILPEAAARADARPLPFPADATAEERAAIDALDLVVTIDGHPFRPTDAAFLATFSATRDHLRTMRELQDSVDAARARDARGARGE